MKTPRLVAVAGFVALSQWSVGLAQSLPDHAPSFAVSGSVVFPADSATDTSIGGSVELEFPLSRSFSAGVIAGHWSGKSDFVKDSTETYLVGVITHRWGAGRWRPFVQLGGGLYLLKFQFQSRSRFSPSETETVGGGFAGPGLDYVLSPRSALEVRARYHLVSDATGSVHPDFLETQLGIRFFF
jgi:hypothetical protein